MEEFNFSSYRNKAEELVATVDIDIFDEIKEKMSNDYDNAQIEFGGIKVVFEKNTDAFIIPKMADDFELKVIYNGYPPHEFLRSECTFSIGGVEYDAVSFEHLLGYDDEEDEDEEDDYEYIEEDEDEEDEKNPLDDILNSCKAMEEEVNLLSLEILKLLQ